MEPLGIIVQVLHEADMCGLQAAHTQVTTVGTTLRERQGGASFG